MRKLFLLIPAMLLAITAGAKEITITPGTANILRTTVNGCTDASNVITLSDNGEYTFDNTEQYIAISHNTTIQAADGAHPVIKPVVPIQISGGATVKFVGVKFDGSIIGSYDYLVRFDDNNANNELEFENCEFTNLSKMAIYVKSSMNGKSLKMTGCTFHDNANYCIYCPSDATLGSCVIDSCYFYSNTQMCLYLENTTATPLTIINSTFANNSTSGSHGVVETKSTSGAISVNHCTFYNCPATSTDHGTVQFVSSDAVVSNSIFVMPSEVEQRAIHMPNDNVVNNCLTYNYTKDDDGIRSGINKTACINTNPLFVDAANADYTLHTASPARGSGTESSDLGASCWTKDVNPSTDFSSSLVLLGVDATLAKNIEYTAEYYLKSNNKDAAEHAADNGTATWKFHATKACAVQVTVNVNSGNESGHNYSAEIFDSTNASKGTVAQSAASWNDQDKTLIGMIVLPEAGDYSIVLSNNQEWSETIIHGITLSYGGGDVTDVPGTLSIANAIHNGTRADGVISFADATTGWAKWNIVVEDEAFYAISIAIKNRWAHTITATIYEEDGITVVGEASKGYSSVYDESGHSVDLGGVYLKAGNYVVKITNSTKGSDAKIASLTFTTAGGAVQAVPGTAANSEAWFSNNGTRADGKISFSTYADAWVKWNLSTTVAGNYNVKLYVENTTKRGHRFVVHVYEANGAEGDPLYSETWNDTYDDTNPLELDCGTFTFAANKKYILKVTNMESGSYAKVINVVTSYVNGKFIDLSLTDLSLPFEDVILSNDWSIADSKISYAESKATTGYAKWNVNCENYANYNVTVNISSDNGHGMKVEVFEDEAEPAIYTLDETSYSTGDLALDLGNITLSDREYVIKITNTISSSHAKIASVVVTYVNGARITLPATLDPDDAELSALAYVESNELYFAPSDKLGHIDEQWAKWNVKVAEAGTFLFTMNVSSTNSQSYKLTIKDGESNVVAEFEKNPGSGAKEMKFYPYLTAGNYTVEAQNTYQWSDGHMVSLVVTEPASLLVLDEAAANNSVIVANYRPEYNQPIQIIRTIVKDMYNTICLPFDVETADLKEIFGKDVVLKEMESATVEEEGYVLNLNFADATSIYRGTPYLIKTSRNIVNPTFPAVEIKEKVGQATASTNADFIGTFIKTSLEANENILFLGANNKLYFPTASVDIYGMRGWFVIHDAPTGAIKRARIVENNNAPTDIEIIGSQKAKANGQKLIENGQLIIVRDGIRYNVMGARVK